MIDLTSTSVGDPQAQRCARLLAAVIVGAINDATKKPGREELRLGVSLDADANAAIRWIYERYGPFEVYSEMIGINPDRLREALDRCEPDERLPIPPIKRARLLALRWRRESMVLPGDKRLAEAA